MVFADAPHILQRALVRRPSPKLADGLITHIDRVPIDIDLAVAQWQGYVDALTGNGWQTFEVPRRSTARIRCSSRTRW